MKKILLFNTFVFLFVLNVLSSNVSDCVYHDLCSFLVYRKVITKDYMENFKDDYSSLIKISEIGEGYIPKKTPDLTKMMGLFEFDFIGRESESAYVLVKNKNTYKIFRKSDISLIIKELLMIKEENPDLISLEMLNVYLKRLVNYDKEEDIVSYPVSKKTFFLVEMK